MDNLEYRDIFITEAQEYLESLNESTLRLEKDQQDLEAVHDLFRAAHTLKGMAATMGYDGITELAHHMEDVLDGIRGGQRQVSRVLVDLVFECIDAMSSLIGKVSTGEDLPSANPDLINRLRQVASGEELDAQPTTGAAPPSGEAEEAPATENGLPDLKALRAAIKEAEDEDLPVFHVHVSVDRKCTFQGVRAFLVMKAVHKLGKVLLTQPDTTKLENGDFDFEFDIWIATNEHPDELKHEITGVLEIEKAEISEFSSRDLPPEEGVEEKAPAAEAAPAQSKAPAKTEEPAEDSAKSAAAPKEEAAPKKESRAPKQSVRVNVERLDRIMNLVGEMVTSKIRLAQISREQGLKDLGDSLTQMDHVINELQDEVMAARMVPMDHVFNRFPRMVRDLAHELGKDIELVVEGRDIELDRTILEEIADPLVHLLRNAVDHGFESTEEREAAGKDAKGLLQLAARREKNQVTIVVEDDGKGMDPAVIKEAAIAKGIISVDEAERLSRDEAVNLIALPGFSTAKTVSRTSGRGVGVDAVKTKIEGLGGTMRIDSEPGRGSRFQLRLPLTLAIIQALMVRQGNEVYAVPVNNVSEAVELEKKDLDMMHNQEVVMLRDEVLQVQRMGRLLEVPGSMETVPDLFTVLVAELEDRKVGLMVDEVLGQQEIAIKSLGRYLKGVRGFGGVTIQGDGSLALIIDVPSLL